MGITRFRVFRRLVHNSQGFPPSEAKLLLPLAPTRAGVVAAYRNARSQGKWTHRISNDGFLVLPIEAVLNRSNKLLCDMTDRCLNNAVGNRSLRILHNPEGVFSGELPVLLIKGGVDVSASIFVGQGQYKISARERVVLRIVEYRPTPPVLKRDWRVKPVGRWPAKRAQVSALTDVKASLDYANAEGNDMRIWRRLWWATINKPQLLLHSEMFEQAG